MSSDVTIGIGAKLDASAKGAAGEMRETVAGLVSEFAAPLNSIAKGESVFGAGIEYLKDRVSELVMGPLGMLFVSLGGIDLTMKALGYSTRQTAEGLQNVQLYENLQAQFKPLLGSMEEAKARMIELQKIADVSPYQLTDVAGASKMLQVLTGGKLAMGDGLKQVIDSAIVSGGNLQDVAMQIGRMYDDIANGRPMGLAARRLEELGLLSGKTRNELEKLLKEGQSGDAVWQVFEKDLERTAGATAQAAKTITGLTTTLADAKNAASRAFGEGFAETEKDSIKASTEAYKQFIPIAQEAGKVANSLGLADWPHMTFPILDVPIKNFIAGIMKATDLWKFFINALGAGAVGMGATLILSVGVSLRSLFQRLQDARAATLAWAQSNDTLGKTLSEKTAAVGKMTLADIEAKAATLAEADATKVQATATELGTAAREAGLGSIKEMTLNELAEKAAALGEAEAQKILAAARNLATEAANSNIIAEGAMIGKQVAARGIIVGNTVAVWLYTNALNKLREVGSLLGRTLISPGNLLFTGLTAIYLYYEHIQDYIQKVQELGAASTDRINQLKAEREAIVTVDDRNKALADGYARLKEAQDAINAAGDDERKKAMLQQGYDYLKKQLEMIEAIDAATLKPGDARAQLIAEAADLHAKALEKQRTTQEQLVFLEQQRVELMKTQADLQAKADASSQVSASAQKAAQDKTAGDAAVDAKIAPLQAQLDASVQRQIQLERFARGHAPDTAKIAEETKIQTDLQAQIDAIRRQARPDSIANLEQQLADSKAREQTAIDKAGGGPRGRDAILRARAAEEPLQADLQQRIGAYSDQSTSGPSDEKAATDLQAARSAAQANQDAIDEVKRKADEEAKAMALKLQELQLERDILNLKTEGTRRTTDEARLRQGLLATQMRANEAERTALRSPMQNYAAEQARLKIEYQELTNKYLEEEFKIQQALASEADRQLEQQAEKLSRAHEMTEKLPKGMQAPLFKQEEDQAKALADQMDRRAEAARKAGDLAGADQWSGRADELRDKAAGMDMRMGSSSDAVPVVDSLQKLGLGGRVAGGAIDATEHLREQTATLKEIRDLLKKMPQQSAAAAYHSYDPGIRIEGGW